MNKITRFKEKSITIDGIIGTIRQLETNSRCEFIYRDKNAIKSSIINKNMLAYNGQEYFIKPDYKARFDRNTQTHDVVIWHWSGCYPNGEYIRRELVLEQAERKSIDSNF
ncbi:MAG: hypothetical protein WC758_03605 [Candidatus Woesearchaeota archaeon]|jgi:hypothetical protein